ncbi:MAG TPA: hypothetical protein PKZ97_16290 [Azospirillaceae bacterium]|nr:hypothetical protein [Azospirillaceae bacterium]
MAAPDDGVPIDSINSRRMERFYFSKIMVGRKKKIPTRKAVKHRLNNSWSHIRHRKQIFGRRRLWRRNKNNDKRNNKNTPESRRIEKKSDQSSGKTAKKRGNALWG